MNYAFAFALGIGFTAGLRSLTPPAVVAWAAHLGWLNLNNSPLAFMGSIIAVVVFSLLAVFELFADLQPSTPKRTAPVPLVARKGINRPVRIDRPLTERVIAPAAIALPVARGDVLGEVRVLSGRRLIARQPLVAARSISRPGALGRVGFYAKRTFSHIGGWFT